jgi:hypothetical protein
MERRKQDLAEFTQLREDYALLEARFAESEMKLADSLHKRDIKASENSRLQDKVTEYLARMRSSEARMLTCADVC